MASHSTTRVFEPVEPTATQTLEDMASELALKGVDELTTGADGRGEKLPWPE